MFSPLRLTFVKDTLFNPFSQIWRNISLFEVFGGKDTLFKVFSTYLETCFTFEEGFGARTLFKAFSTYLEETFLHEEMPCGIVDMVKPSNE
jgi:hypothetical protein